MLNNTISLKNPVFLQKTLKICIDGSVNGGIVDRSFPMYSLAKLFFQFFHPFGDS